MSRRQSKKSSKSERFRLAIMSALNLENQSIDRTNLDVAIMNYYSSLKPKSFDLVLCAAVSSERAGALCADCGWTAVRASNDNVGAKRNAGLEYCLENADAIVRIGSDDVASLSLLEFVVDRFEREVDKYIELYGFAFLDATSQRLALFRHKQYAFAFMAEPVKGAKLYNEDGSTIDSGLDIRLRSLCGDWSSIKYDDSRPFIACKSGDEINSFDKLIEQEYKLAEWLDSERVLSEHFPTLNFETSNASTENISRGKKSRILD